MGEIYIKPYVVKEDAERYTEIINSINSEAEELSSIASNLNYSASFELVKLRVNRLVNNIIKESSDLRSLQSGLIAVTDAYIGCENKITDFAGVIARRKQEDGENGGDTENHGEESEDPFISADDIISFIEDELRGFLDDAILDLLEDLLSLDGLSDAAGIAKDVIDFAIGVVADLWNALTVGATPADLISIIITDYIVTGTEILGGLAVEAAIIAICTAAFPTGGEVVGKIVGGIAGDATSELIDKAWDADWDHDGESNKAELADGISDALEWTIDKFAPDLNETTIKIDMDPDTMEKADRIINGVANLVA